MQLKGHPTVYQIRVAEHLDERWLRWFEDLVILQNPNGETLINGSMDQAALHAILNRIGNLGLELISVQRYRSTDDLPKS